MMNATRPFLLGSCVISDCRHQERRGMPLHAGGVNCEKGATTDIKAHLSSIGLRSECWEIVSA